MKKLLLVGLLLSSLSALAQETYMNAQLATEDLNGTARYVGMGGAMEALGGDLSTIATNPAGIGLFRSSQAKVSFGLISQENAADFNNADKTHLTFDQVGFVYSMSTNRNSFLNLAFNYRKSRDFNQILTAANVLSNASQNALTYNKGLNGLLFDSNNKSTNLYNQLDFLYWENFIKSTSDNGEESYGYNVASEFAFGRHNTGYIGEYDFNISGNIKDRVYLGLTFGIHDVHYNSSTSYTENLLSSTGQSVGNVQMDDEHCITGTGYDIKVGGIVRPVEYSPFRIGFSIATPTWYDLTSSNVTLFTNRSDFGTSDRINEAFDFRFNTPWKFGLSMGTTVDDYLALGASYEYADYSATDNRLYLGSGYDYYSDSYYDDTESDNAMNNHTKRTLKGVHTLKLGAEFRPDPSLAIRLGYNYVSPMYNKLGERNFNIDSPYAFYASTTDYTNWKATNRITAGMGYTLERFTIDVAYQYQSQKGDFYPFANFMPVEEGSATTIPITEVKNNRHQLMMTLGYRF